MEAFPDLFALADAVGLGCELKSKRGYFRDHQKFDPVAAFKLLALTWQLKNLLICPLLAVFI
jgi:hypothetical protein